MNSAATRDDEAFIQKLWQNEECLDLDSIQFGTGEVVLLDSLADIPDDKSSIQIKVKEKTTIRAAAQLPSVTLNVGLTASATLSVELEDLDLRISGGECAGYGTFGFVAVSRLSDDYLVWLAFFLNSNPFVSLLFDGENVVATTNLGARFVFPMREPEQVRVVCQP